MAKRAEVAKLPVDDRIVEVRGVPALLDSDLAAIYGVTTKALNQAVKRNRHRFPTDIAEFSSGGTPSKSLWDGSIPWVSAKDMKRFRLDDTEDHVTQAGVTSGLTIVFPDRFEDSELGEIPAGWGVGTITDFASLNPEAWAKETRPAIIRYVDLSNTTWGRIEAVTVHDRDSAPSRAQRVLQRDTIVGTVRLFAQARKRKELSRTSVYVLIGPPEESGLPRIYAGEGDPIGPRLGLRRALSKYTLDVE